MIVKVRDPDPAYPFISRLWIIENPLSEVEEESVTSVQRFHRTFSGMTYQFFRSVLRLQTIKIALRSPIF